MAVTAFNKAKYLIISQELDLLTDDMYILLTSGYTPDIDNHDFVSDVSAYEVTGGSYVRKLLAGKTLTRDDVNNWTKFEADDLTWININVITDGAILYKDVSSTDNLSPLVAYISFTQKSPSNTQFKINWSDEQGLIYLM